MTHIPPTHKHPYKSKVKKPVAPHLKTTALKGAPPAPPPRSSPRLTYLEDLDDRRLFHATRQLLGAFQIKSEELASLIGIEAKTLYRWQTVYENGGAPVFRHGSRDRRDRIIILLQIYESLCDLLQDKQEVRQWLRQKLELPAFEGKTPLEIMNYNFEGMINIKNYLEYLHTAWS